MIGVQIRTKEGTHQPGRVYQSDALVGMSSMNSNQAGAVITDPPFHIVQGRVSDGVGYGMGRDPWTDVSTVDAAILWTMPLAEHISRILRPGGAFIVMGSSQSLAAWEVANAKCGLMWMSELTILWNTGKPRNRNFGSLFTAARWYVKPGARHTFNSAHKSIYSNVIIATKIPLQRRLHPAQKPVELTNVFVSLMTDPDDLVVDPFCGSGSTLVSAAICGRPYIGYDSDAEYVAMARRRSAQWEIEQAELEPIKLWVNGKAYEIED